MAYLILFLASTDNSDDLRLVKLITSEYGITVHQKSATNDLAPQVYGSKCLEGAPTAYIMEYLTPPSPQLVLREIGPDSNSQGKFTSGLWIA